MYPLKFYPIYKERIWGGQTLKTRFGRNCGSDKVGESWEIACHHEGTSTISNGPWIGKSLSHIVTHYGRQLLGTALRDDAVKKFPLLMKLLDASDRLSVQVHPDDQYAFENENGELGKAEMWYVVDAKPGAKIVFGLKPGVAKEEFAAAIKEGKVEALLQEVEVKAGDIFNIPAGVVHALGAGVLVAEVQQNSDTVYRVFDYNRVDAAGKPRELHVQKALDVIDFKAATDKGPIKGIVIESAQGYSRRLVVANQYFAVEVLDIDTCYSEVADSAKFVMYTNLGGDAVIHHHAGDTALASGESCLIPAGIGKYEIETLDTSVRLIRSYVPDLETDVVMPLKSIGYNRDDVRHLVGGLS